MKWLNLKGSNQISHKNISYTLSYAKLKALNEQYQDISDQWLMALGMCSLRSEINYPGQSTIQICISYLALQEDQRMRTESESVSMGWYNPQWCQDLHTTAGTARAASTNVRTGMAGARGAGRFCSQGRQVCPVGAVPCLVSTVPASHALRKASLRCVSSEPPSSWEQRMCNKAT